MRITVTPRRYAELTDAERERDLLRTQCAALRDEREDLLRSIENGRDIARRIAERDPDLFARASALIEIASAVDEIPPSSSVDGDGHHDVAHT